MLQKIKTHNYLNGNVFSLVEFLLTALLLMPFTIFYFSHTHYIFGVIGLGIILNCFAITMIAAMSLWKREPSIGIFKLYSNKEARKKALSENPHMSSDTFILCMALLIPFFLFIATIYDITGY